jgi:DNA-directed RNA polymerase subunit beta'
LKENVVVGRLIPAGTGLSYHAARKKAYADKLNSDSVTASDVEAALSEALNIKAEG